MLPRLTMLGAMSLLMMAASPEAPREDATANCLFDSWCSSRLDPAVPVFLSWEDPAVIDQPDWDSVLDRNVERFTLPRGLLPGVAKPDCAIVGGSRNLLGSGYGPLIDSHPVVMRINHAERKGYEADVGRRATHHFLKFRSQGWVTLDPDSVIVYRVDTRDGLSQLDFTWRKDGLLVLHPDFQHYVFERWLDESFPPSSGLDAILIGLYECGTIDVFGFGANADGCWDHYFSDFVECPAQEPTIDRETAIRNELEARKIIRVFPGNR